MKSTKIIFGLFLCIMATSCFTVKKVPEVNAQGYTITQGKKLKKSLGKSNYFVFHNHLYDNDLTSFIQYKLKTDANSFLQNIKVDIKGTSFLMTFHTVTSKEKRIDLLAPFVNRAINNSLRTDFDENIKNTETEFYYVAVYVESDIEADSLKEESIHRAIVENYLVSLMNEYYNIGSSQELDFIIGKN